MRRGVVWGRLRVLIEGFEISFVDLFYIYLVLVFLVLFYGENLFGRYEGLYRSF